MDAKYPIRLYFSPKGSSWQAPAGPKRPSYGQIKTFWGHWGPKSGTFGPKQCPMCHLACIQVFLVHFFTKHKSTGWPKASECPKMHIYGQMRAHWPNSIGANSIMIIKGPIRGPLGPKIMSNGSVSMDSSVFHPFSMKQANWLVMAPKGLFMAK